VIDELRGVDSVAEERATRRADARTANDRDVL